MGEKYGPWLPPSFGPLPGERCTLRRGMVVEEAACGRSHGTGRRPSWQVISRRHLPDSRGPWRNINGSGTPVMFPSFAAQHTSHNPQHPLWPTHLWTPSPASRPRRLILTFLRFSASCGAPHPDPDAFHGGSRPLQTLVSPLTSNLAPFLRNPPNWHHGS